MKEYGILTRYLIRRVSIAVSITCMITGCAPQGNRYAYTVPVETNDGWQTASLAEKDIDNAPLVSLMNRLHEHKNHLIHSLLLVKDGSLVFEEYFEGEDLDLFDKDFLRDGTLNLVHKRFTRDDLHYCASVTKSVTSQAFGIALDGEYVSDVDDKMLSFFPDHTDLDSPEKSQISVHHMLTMTTGLPFDEQTYPISDPRNDAFRLYFNEDPVAFVLGKDVVHAPGTFYQYNSGTTVLLGEIIRRTTGQNVPSFADEHLFTPLQISSYEWAEMPKAPGISYTAGGLYLRPRDMAKIGQLMLQDGVWKDRRVLSSDWVRRSVAQAIPVSGGGNVRGYGYQWKLGRFGGSDAFWAAGWGGQYIVVLPEQNVVLVQTGGRYRGEKITVNNEEIIEDYILPAIEGHRSEAVRADPAGEWTGYVILGNGSRADIRMSMIKSKKGYTGLIRGESGVIPEMQLRKISFKGNRLTYELDFPNGRTIELIRFDLRYRDDVLEGSYTDPTGDSDQVVLRRKQ
jgi:CubicO group peptidase (beta-lactamase class C family)